MPVVDQTLAVEPVGRRRPRAAAPRWSAPARRPGPAARRTRGCAPPARPTRCPRGAAGGPAAGPAGPAPMMPTCVRTGVIIRSASDFFKTGDAGAGPESGHDTSTGSHRHRRQRHGGLAGLLPPPRLRLRGVADKEPHVEVTLPGGLRLAWDNEETIRSFDPDWTPPTGRTPGRPRLHAAPTRPRSTGSTPTWWAPATAGHREPWDAFWGQRYAVVHDPDGNAVDLFAPLDSGLSRFPEERWSGVRRPAPAPRGPGGPGRRTRWWRRRWRTARPARASASARSKRSTRASVFGPYPNEARQRRCSWRALRPPGGGRADDRVARDRSAAGQPPDDRLGRAGPAQPRADTAAARAAAGCRRAGHRVGQRRVRPARHSASSGARPSRSSSAGTPSSGGAHPGWNRTPTYVGPTGASWAAVSGPATNRSPVRPDQVDAPVRHHPDDPGRGRRRCGSRAPPRAGPTQLPVHIRHPASAPRHFPPKIPPIMNRSS